MQAPRRRRRPRLRGLSINRLLPNLLTIFALVSGLTSIRFAIQDRWELAVIAILVAAILDVMDGGVARLLKASSPLGAQLDSLSDFVCFGVAPALLFYLWTGENAGSLGWLVTLAFAICAAMRLARFNVDKESDAKPAWAATYFTGVPSPAGAGLALLPMMIDFQAGPGIGDYPVLIALWTVTVGLLMVSNLSTFSLKKVRIPERHLIFVMVGLGLLIAALFSAPWETLTILALLYLCTLPISQLRYQRQMRETAEKGEIQPDALNEAILDEIEDEDSEDEDGPPPADAPSPPR